MDWKQRLGKILKSTGPFLALILMCIILGILSDDFFTIRNLMNVARQSSINGIVALGAMLAILTAGIDLSVGSIVGFSGAILGLAYVRFGLPAYVSIFLSLFCGVAVGFTNGILLTKLHLPHPFISTLGTMRIFRGLTLIVLSATPITGVPRGIQLLGGGFFGVIPISLIFLILCYLLMHFFLTKTTMGRYIYAVGGNKEAAYLSGVKVDKVLIVVYSISGFAAALAALVLAGRVDAVFPLAGDGYEMDAIAAVIIGGTSFFGGVGSVWGTFVGAFLMGVLRNGLNLLNVSSNIQIVAIGVIIILAVYIDVLRQHSLSRVK
jgi:ribose transport system permease protein